MYSKTFFIFFCFSLNSLAEIQFRVNKIKPDSFKQFLSTSKELSETEIEYIKKSRTIVNSEASTIENKSKQSLDFYISKLHPKKCSIALPRLSTFEKYREYMGFIDKSKYLEKSKEVYFLIKSSLLPYDMHLKFKLPRITEPGLYNFKFENGIFKGLKGSILAINYIDRCLIYSQAKWIGPNTKIPVLAIELFSETLSKLSINKIFRATSL